MHRENSDSPERNLTSGPGGTRKSFPLSTWNVCSYFERVVCRVEARERREKNVKLNGTSGPSPGGYRAHLRPVLELVLISSDLSGGSQKRERAYF